MKTLEKTQINGWSVHHHRFGILGPAYLAKDGKIYYLDLKFETKSEVTFLEFDPSEMDLHLDSLLESPKD